MGTMQRTKGQTGELLATHIDGYSVTSDGRVFSHKSGKWLSPARTPRGYVVYGLRHASASRGDIRAWWAQARPAGLLPVLLYRRDRDQWRAVWPVGVHLALQVRDYWTSYEWTVEGTPDAWAAVAREINTTRGNP